MQGRRQVEALLAFGYSDANLQELGKDPRKWAAAAMLAVTGRDSVGAAKRATLPSVSGEEAPGAAASRGGPATAVGLFASAEPLVPVEIGASLARPPLKPDPLPEPTSSARPTPACLILRFFVKGLCGEANKPLLVDELSEVFSRWHLDAFLRNSGSRFVHVLGMGGETEVLRFLTGESRLKILGERHWFQVATSDFLPSSLQGLLLATNVKDNARCRPKVEGQGRGGRNDQGFPYR